jgi:hypothetical protein
MEGGGSYNLHAKIPAGGGSLALPFLEQAVRNATLDGVERPVVIADYGSSQGKHSLAPMRAAIIALRARLGPDRPILDILVVHIDQAANDFNTLFDVLHSDLQSYSVNDPSLFPSAIGRSFYESVFPRERVHLGRSSYAAVWLRRIPTLIPDHFMMLANFLSLRANEALAEMVAEGTICAEERAAMVLGADPRRRSQLLAPFNPDGQFRGLTVEHCELSLLPDAVWTEFEQDANKKVLATRHARFFRSVFEPSLASAIADEGKRNVFSDRLEEKLKRRLTDRPVPLHFFVQTIVLAKQDFTPTPAVQN